MSKTRSKLIVLREQIKERLHKIDAELASIKPALENSYDDILLRELTSLRTEQKLLLDINIQLREITRGIV